MRMLRPLRRSAFLRHVSARIAPSQTAAASSKVMLAGLCASGPLSRMQTNSASAPKAYAMAPKPYWLTPKTRSPTSNSLTAAQLLHLAGQLAAEDLPLRSEQTGGEAGEEILGAAKSAVGPADRRGVDLDEDLVVLGYWLLDLIESQSVRRPVPLVDNCSQALT